jgi:SnoaL-like domain
MPDSLATKQAVADMLFRYCRGLDRMDKPLALSVFHPNSEVDYGHVYTGSGPGFVDFVFEQHRHAARHCHQITNLYVEPAGERASSEAYVMLMMRVEAADAVTIIQGCGRYLDEWGRHDGGWVILRRQAIMDFQEAHALAKDMLPTALCPSRRDRSDPSYALNPKLTFA